MNFNKLIKLFKNTHEKLRIQAAKSVNMSLTIRNWIFGYYIVEYEQNGEDRAKYGTKLLEKLSAKIKIKGLPAPELSRCRQFYNTYPQILGMITQEFRHLDFVPGSIHTQKILGMPSQEFTTNEHQSINKLVSNISYSHFTELIKIDDPLKRKFYELLVLKTQPSVSEFRRSIHTLTFERFGMTGNKPSAMEDIQKHIEPTESTDMIKSHYFFEFLDINKPELIEETELEQALIDHLQEFILELGYGFCFEARQKRILIEDEYFFIDLVFYHRILKCHVLVELKTNKAKHEHIGQLKAYLEFYKRKIKNKDDNPPVGILLVTDKNKTLVEYAIADSDKELFVSKYKLQLPKRKEIEDFITNELSKL